MRKFVFAAGLAALAALGGCTAAQIETATTIVEGDIQTGSSLVCGVVPTLETITSIAAVLFPGVASIAAIGAAGEAAIEKEVCSAAPAPASLKFGALPKFGVAPAGVIGISPHQVVVKGWRAK